MNSNTDWPWPTIKAAIEQEGTTLERLSIDAGMSKGYLYKAKYSPLAKAQAIIAQSLCLPPQSIWPTRYARDGRPLRPAEWCGQNSSKSRAERLVHFSRGNEHAA